MDHIDDNRSRRSRSRYTPDIEESKRKHRRSYEEDKRDSSNIKRRRYYHEVLRDKSTHRDERRSRSRTLTESRRRKRSRRREHEHRPSRSPERRQRSRRRSGRRRRVSTKNSGSSSSSTVSGSPAPSQGKGSNTSVLGNNEMQLFLSELVKSLSNNRPGSNRFPMLGNIIPEFDPMVKSQTIHMWINKVDECAKLYNWSDDQIIHYALPKLVGVARVWYQAVPAMSFTWSEWKARLIDNFPSSDDYAELLNEMLSRRAKYHESLELYYYDKINLLNRCEIFGKRAVDCILHGIDDRSLRLGAKAANSQEPEQVLRYFQSSKQNRENDRNKLIHDKKHYTSISSNSNVNTKQQYSNESKTFESQTSVVCYNCNETGHFSFKCPKKILKCTVCNRIGHLTVNCPRLPHDSSKESEIEIDK